MAVDRSSQGDMRQRRMNQKFSSSGGFTIQLPLSFDSFNQVLGIALGDGVFLDSSFLEVKLRTTSYSGLEIDATGLGINLATTTPGLAIGSSGIYVLLASNSMMTSGTTGLDSDAGRREWFFEGQQDKVAGNGGLSKNPGGLDNDATHRAWLGV